MAPNSLKHLHSFIWILMVLTILILINIGWSISYLYKLININVICDEKCYKTAAMAAISRVNISSTIQQTIRIPELNPRTERTTVNSIKMAPVLVSKTSPTIQRTNHRTVLIPSKSRNSNFQPTNRPDTCTNCFQHNFKYIIQNEAVCNPTINYTSVELVVLVFTVHNHFKQREVIRKTWLSLSRVNTGIIRHVFLLGDSSDIKLSKEVELENNVYHDIIKESFVDSYKNLTYKTMMGFKWVTFFCSNAKFVMKTDDDMYVNIPAILKVLKKEKTALQTSVSGACTLTAKPVRNQKSKWFTSTRNYPHNSYPGYCSGTGYVTSRTVVEKVYEISKHVPFFYLEDVYVSLCVRRLGFTLRSLPGFNSYKTNLNPCQMRSDQILTSHMVPTDFLLTIRDAKCN